MKAIMILIVAAGTTQGSSFGPDQTLQVREIAFSSMAACNIAAHEMTAAGRRGEQYSRIFAVDNADNVLTPGPVVIAECVLQ